MTLTIIHDRLAITAVIFTAICAIWGLIIFLRKGNISGSYWGTLAIAELLMIAQMVIGVVLWAGGGRPGRGGVHLLYGITAIISLPALFLYIDGKDTRREAILFAIVSLWLFFISLRAMTTGY
ncbi:MAG: hypothetical protein U9R25_09140 [Chloroflexota bacterium]|nr:hypothetical protein [Chloroflexota bacterium]